MSIFQTWNEDDEHYIYKVIFVGGGGFCCKQGHLSAPVAADCGARVLINKALEAHAA